MGKVLAITLTIQSLVSAAALTVPVLAPALAPVFGVPGELVGVYVALIYVGAMFSSLAAGGYVARFGAIRISQGSLLMCALGLACSLTAVPVLAAAGALLIGCGYGQVTPASSHLLVKTTPTHRMSLVFSIKQTGVPLGGVLAGLFLPRLDAWTGWRGAVLVAIIACIVSAVGVQFSRKDLDADRTAGSPLGLGNLREPVRVIIRHSALRLLSLGSLTFSAVQLCFTAYLVTFLHDSLGYTLIAAGVMMSVSQVAGVVGRVLWGWCADRFVGAIAMLTVLGVAMAVFCWVLAGLVVGTPPALLVVVLIALGSAALGWNGVYLAEVARQAPPGQTSIATGGTLAATFLGVVVGPPIFAGIASLANSYRPAFMLIAIPALIMGLVFAWRRKNFAA
ncbi:MAG TPA: MFS transporter [Burkholderiaceae bacterium]|nr:MFS transporter [Burkholderiaceae bacterium]